MLCCNSQCILAVRFETHQILNQVLQSRVHKHASKAADHCTTYDQTLLSFMLSSMFVGPNLHRSKHKHECNGNLPYMRHIRNAKAVRCTLVLDSERGSLT